jgi:peptidoglycan/LPS O-acetylase OafA/YrhL
MSGEGLRLGRFWEARARRLLPALLVMLLLVTLWVVLIGPSQPRFAESVGAALLYVSNWQLVFQHVSYFQRFGPPTALSHLWSLGIEEQFYLLWPLLLILGVKYIPERSRVSGVRPRLAALTLLLAAASVVDMWVRYRPSITTSPVYFGTDTRAFELLVGAALAMVWPSRLLQSKISPGARRVCDTAGVVGLVAIVLLVMFTTQYSAFLYHGGFVLLTLATALAVAALVHPAGRIGALLGIGVLRWIGVRSYGIYLWHMPVVALTTPARDHGVNVTRSTLQIAATIALAALSWRLVEEPIRYGSRSRVPGQPRPSLFRLPTLRKPGLTALLQTVALVALVVTVAVLTAAGNSGHRSAAHPPKPLRTTSGARSNTTAAAVVNSPAGKTLAAVPAAPTRTACRSVIDIGDSTSEGLISKSYLPNPAQRIEARYTKVGVKVQHYEISGARSIVETHEGEPNATDVAEHWMDHGYQGCWVLALGTNDAADVYAGSHVGLADRIRQMMLVIGNEPVLWVDTKSLLQSGPYAESNMQSWNDALAQVCAFYPKMRIFEWSARAQDAWFIDDGIHYNTPGYAARARLIAAALAKAFPAGGGTSTGCAVR